MFQVSGGSDVNLGSPVLDTVTSGGGSPASPVQQTNTDSYGSPQVTYHRSQHCTHDAQHDHPLQSGKSDQ